jgi:hypothetical protein
MGPKEKQPAPPEIEWCLLPDAHRFVSKRLQECNYLQAFEGGIDSSHVAWAHRFEMDVDPMHNRSKATEIIKRSSGVVFQIEEVPSGLLIFARREAVPRTTGGSHNTCFPGSRLSLHSATTRWAAICGFRSMTRIAGRGA